MTGKVRTPQPIQQYFANNAAFLVGGKLFCYLAGTTTKATTYSNSTGTPNTNPVIGDARGEMNVFLDPTIAYKFVLSPSTDTDPPTNPIWTEDNIVAFSGAVSIHTITSNYTVQASDLLAGDLVIEANAQSGSITVTVPVSLGSSSGSPLLTVLKTDATGNMVAISDGTNPIDLITTPATAAGQIGGFKSVYSNGTNLRCFGVT